MTICVTRKDRCRLRSTCQFIPILLTEKNMLPENTDHVRSAIITANVCIATYSYTIRYDTIR